MAMLTQISKCLYCVWPGVIFLVARFLWKMIETKTYYGALTVGVDPLSPQGQGEFETSRMRNKEKRQLIYWCIGIAVIGYLAAFAASYFKLI